MSYTVKQVYEISILLFLHNISYVGETVTSQTSLLETGQSLGSSSAVADLLFNISCCSANIRAQNNWIIHAFYVRMTDSQENDHQHPKASKWINWEMIK